MLTNYYLLCSLVLPYRFLDHKLTSACLVSSMNRELPVGLNGFLKNSLFKPPLRNRPNEQACSCTVETCSIGTARKGLKFCGNKSYTWAWNSTFFYCSHWTVSVILALFVSIF